MSRGDRRGLRAVAVLAVTMMALLSGCAAFQSASEDVSEDATVQGKSPTSSATPTPGATPTRDKASRDAPARRVTATGQQLWAAQPLANIHQDQGSSIQLPDGRTLWIFADTFQLYNDPKFFITSAAAVTNPGYWQLQYSMGGTVRGKPIPAEFMPRTPSEKADRKSGDHYQAIWPTGSTLLPDGRIIISYAKYRVLLKTKQYTYMGAGLFQFKYRGIKKFRAGDQARRIADNLWTAADGEVRSPIYADGFVYFTRCKNLRCYSLRVTPDALTKRQAYSWWTGSGWSTSSANRQAVTVRTNHPGGNPSIVRLKNGLYAMADTEAGTVSRVGHLWISKRPHGPWSRAATFNFAACPAPGCYGLNLHPEQSSGTSLRVSYATTSVGPFVRVLDVPVKVDPDGSWIQVT
jgi:hypothetical protein